MKEFKKIIKKVITTNSTIEIDGISQEPTSEVSTEIVVKYDFTDVPVGAKFTATISGKECKGRIQKENGNIFLCQNLMDGEDAKNKLGYKYSWVITGFNFLESSTSVKNVEIELDPDFIDTYVEPEVFPVGEYKASFFKGFIRIGCQTITNECVRKVVEKLVD